MSTVKTFILVVLATAMSVVGLILVIGCLHNHSQFVQLRLLIGLALGLSGLIIGFVLHVRNAPQATHLPHYNANNPRPIPHNKTRAVLGDEFPPRYDDTNRFFNN